MRAPARRCATVGCGAPAQGGRGHCPTHERRAVQIDNRARGSAASQGYGARWRHFRAWYLECYPLCGDRAPGAPSTRDSRCAAVGRLEPASVVDHIVPVYGPDDPTFYEDHAMQSLCATCHNAKRQREQQLAVRRA